MTRLISCLFVFSIATLSAQPRWSGGAIRFEFVDTNAISVSLVGDFNGWAKDEAPLKRGDNGRWSIARVLSPGIYQYKFLVNGQRYEIDPANPASVENYNQSGRNSVFVLTEGNEVEFSGDRQEPKANHDDQYPPKPGTKPVYLNIIWHQHQPLYVDPQKDQLQGPWVRTHATKDYYDMAAILRQYPDVHCTINLTSSLLFQLEEYYLKRLGPFIDTRKNRIDINAFWRKWKGKTDPWIDLALKPTGNFDAADKAFLYGNIWNAFGISEVMLERFPEYAALKSRMNVDQMPGNDLYTTQQMREIKFWFYLAYFDPDFLLAPVRLADGSLVDVARYVERRGDGKFYLKVPVTEDDCRRIVVEAYKVMRNVIPVHRELRYDIARRKGQIELITTPYYHPILPLIYDSDLARVCQPDDRLPTRFNYPQDASAQVSKAVRMYERIFNATPDGMWPGEGAVAQPVLDVFRKNGIRWVASDAKVLSKSDPPDQPNTTPYRCSTANPAFAGASGSPMRDRPGMSIALVFRDTELSDRIGFTYQTYKGEDAAEDFVQTILSRAPDERHDDVLITVILDGENAWEWYRRDADGKEFLAALYRKLTKLYGTRQIITTTPSEYIDGNASRGIKPHPIEQLPRMEKLWPGSWINANFDTWIGEDEENRAWEYLLRARQDLGKSTIAQPDPKADAPKARTKAWYGWKAWEEMYAAEGSDWFWWYGSDQTAPAGDKPFDDAFRVHLDNVYKFARLAGARIFSPGFDPIITENNSQSGGQGAMARNTTRPVLFTCDASTEHVSDAVFIAGSIPELGSWTPNLVRMYDDGTHGDLKAGDGVWSLQISIPIGEEVQYKYTNSGKRGEWVPGEEFSGNNRSFRIGQPSQSVTIISDTFGKK